jgi:hypothetical protein
MVNDSACECVWSCGRGRTRMSCQLRQGANQDFHIEVWRNNRAYGAYRFAGRDSALVFADRLRHSFEGNGWVADNA